MANRRGPKRQTIVHKAHTQKNKELTPPCDKQNVFTAICDTNILHP